MLVVAGIAIALNAKQVLMLVGVSSKVPVFSFDVSAAPGWWNTENYNNQANDPREGDEPAEKLAQARMNIFKGVKGDGATACFVMYTYYNYPADANTVSDQHEPAASTEITVQRLDDVTTSMATPDGEKSYVLHKYVTSGPGSENSMKGTSYGLIDLGDGYITVSGVCPTGDDLDDTIAGMRGVSLLLQ